MSATKPDEPVQQAHHERKAQEAQEGLAVEFHF
jgi:hypothetical protein